MTILYFTATGNSLYIAKQFAAQHISIPNAIKRNEYNYEDEAIGIISPIHCNMPPKIVLEFLKKAKLSAPYKFMILTYGHQNFNASGIADKLIDNHRFDLIKTILMVDNYLPIFDIEKEMKIDKNINEQIETIKKMIEHKEKNIPKVQRSDLIKHNAIWDYFQKNPELNDGSQLMITSNCVGCGICVKVCPEGNLYLENDIAKRKNDKCLFCLACANLCTNKAIICKISDKNPQARYKNPNISLCEIIKANSQIKK